MRFWLSALLASLLLPVPALASKNPVDYPVAVHVLQIHRERDRFGVTRGWGRGNIREGDSLHAFDFSFDGCSSLAATVGNLSLPGKWKKSAAQMQVLIARIGSADKFDTCDLKTTVRTQVYVRGRNGGIRALDQEQFKAWRARREAARARRQGQSAQGEMSENSAQPNDPE